MQRSSGKCNDFFCHFCQKQLFEFDFFIIIGQQDVKLGKICVSCAKKTYKKSILDFGIGFAEPCSRLLISPKEMELVDFCQALGVYKQEILKSNQKAAAIQAQMGRKATAKQVFLKKMRNFSEFCCIWVNFVSYCYILVRMLFYAVNVNRGFGGLSGRFEAYDLQVYRER